MGKSIAFGFIAGALAVAIFFNGAWIVLQDVLGWLPAAAPRPWALEPRVPPYGVPRVANLIFWGGVWGSVLALALCGARGAAYWILWTLLGAVALTLVGNFVVPLIKGQSLENINKGLSLVRFRNGLILNGMWGLGAAILLKLFGAAPRPVT